ncbi:uncharacterized protein zgc:174935 [Hoplias malabaricus]|uniref:uncharacterized protein zgc:174935 n=1 Tax=Hoplias malabaricus TaxID=27720 RepID=UPI003462E1FA
MRCQVLLLAVLLLGSLGLAGYIHNNRKEELKLAKHASFQNVKHRVTRDVLKEYLTHVVESSSLLDKTKKQIEELKVDVAGVEQVAKAKKAEEDACSGDLKRITDEGAAIDTDKTNTDGEFQKKKADLQEQIATLKKEAEQQSKVCNYIKKDSIDGQKLCGTENKGEMKKAEPEEGVNKENTYVERSA